MHALRSTRTLIAGLALAAFTLGLNPGTASALPKPGPRAQPFKLFARALGSISVNRVVLGLANIGNVGVDSSGRGQTQGGFWPRGTVDNYIFNAGIQVAGVVQGTKPANPWGADTAGALFFDATGQHPETEGVTNVYNAANPADVASWPSDAFVPQGDAVADLYAAPLQGLISASQGDAHFISWEGNPALSNGRPHPLGILVDHRLLAWNYPSGNQDVVYLVLTFYNITSGNAADYASSRPGIRQLLIDQGTKFQALNNARFGITLPPGGYTIGPMYAAMASDEDVGNAGNNFGSVNLPFAMGFAYDASFGKGTAGWAFDPGIFGAPFFPGVGFAGIKYLKGPDGPGFINLFSNTVNGNINPDPATTFILYRLLAGTPLISDGLCNIPGVPADTHICFVQKGTPVDIRTFESSAALTLAPGEFKTIVAAFIFAPPVAIPGFTPVATTIVDPGNPTWTASPDSMLAHNGANQIDSITGFIRYTGPLKNPDGSNHFPLQSEFVVVKGSLLGKAAVAQAVFDAKFLQEFSPDSPQFFLIPGDKQVTILWKPSATETTGDPFFAVVGNPKNADGSVNPLYDPNYRQFDVEGYRIYRGRSDNPSSLKLIAQFDYAGTKFKDFTGAVVNGSCAPELGIQTDCPIIFPTPATPTPQGTAPTKFASYNIGPQSGGAPLIFEDQTCAGCRLALAGGTTSLTIVADTAVSGASDGGFPPLADTGVPFVFVDKAGAPGCQLCGVSNGVPYFYAVTAFDVNSPGHGPTSLESAKLTKQVTPQAPASNFSTSGNLTVSALSGRNGPLTDAIVPTIDTATGEFSKKFPPSNGATLAVGALVSQVLKTVNATVQLDSIILNTAASGGGGTELATDWLSVTNTLGTQVFSLPIQMQEADFAGGYFNAGFSALAVDSASSALFGGGAGFTIPASIKIYVPGGYTTGIMGRGCVNSGSSGNPLADAAGDRHCVYNGPRWFNGDNETKANPNSDNPDLFDGRGAPVTFSNSGELAGVSKIFRPIEYFLTASSWRDFGGAMAPFISDADYRMYWGAGGKVDSVIDLTHNVVVPFDTRITASWGFLNPSAVAATGTYDGRAALSFTDVSCVPNFKTQPALQSLLPCTAAAAPLAATAIPGQIVICADAASYTCNKTAAAEPNPGFMLYIKGHIFMMELTSGLPTAGTQWTMRDYTGGIVRGNGNAGNWGPYKYTANVARPFTSPGVSFKISVSTTNTVADVTAGNLSSVHTVPDPYYVTSAYDLSVDQKKIEFVNVPTGAIIRIYSASGILIRVLQNNSTSFGGIVDWDVRNRTNQFVSSGVYFYNVEAGGLNHTGRMTIVQYASTVQ